jgi:hypothetical protein
MADQLSRGERGDRLTTRRTMMTPWGWLRQWWWHGGSNDAVGLSSKTRSALIASMFRPNAMPIATRLAHLPFATFSEASTASRPPRGCALPPPRRCPLRRRRASTMTAPEFANCYELLLLTIGAHLEVILPLSGTSSTHGAFRNQMRWATIDPANEQAVYIYVCANGHERKISTADPTSIKGASRVQSYSRISATGSPPCVAQPRS